MAILMSFKAAATESSDCGCCCSGSEPDPRIQNDLMVKYYRKRSALLDA